MKVDFNMIKELSYEEGSKVLKDAGYIVECQQGESNEYDYTSDDIFTLYDEFDNELHQIVYARYYNVNSDDGSDDILMLEKWEDLRY